MFWVSVAAPDVPVTLLLVPDWPTGYVMHVFATPG